MQWPESSHAMRDGGGCPLCEDGGPFPEDEVRRDADAWMALLRPSS